MGFFSDIMEPVVDIAGDILGPVAGGIGEVLGETGLFGKKDAGLKGLDKLAAAQAEIAKQQWATYKKEFQPYEIENVQAQREVFPEYKRLTTEGIDVGRRMDEAAAEVKSQMALGEGIRRREISRYGIDPSSSYYGNVANIQAIEGAKGVAGARTAAKTQAESEKYNRLGLFLNKPVANIGDRATQTYSGAAQTYTSLANQLLNRPSMTSSVMGLLGGGIGAFLGGPEGAAIGYGVGSSFG